MFKLPENIKADLTLNWLKDFSDYFVACKKHDRKFRAELIAECSKSTSAVNVVTWGPWRAVFVAKDTHFYDGEFTRERAVHILPVINKARHEGDYEKADALRNNLVRRGYKILQLPEGTLAVKMKAG